ncbi:putative Flp pilus-assembly TadE/G-like [Longilinea arvoryzae]|uniref:Putative Flp pilus-assembly TadE/G-like n=1 Tax=Longilinea arvoryzae TaxID=360412 RepID=A0A0S7BLU6_9CHLR|nr:pilus assembly protein TadG-related protein [Longilinea arvoryzae]GAP15651.1 putative Flp pilus-assembly TadE/G-like [Longilinea arvoryzae]
MKSTLEYQRGQVIILFVLALVGLLAFAGLAVDGAMLYSDRRASQSAADSAALAGAGAGGNTMQLREIYSKPDFNCNNLNYAGTKMNLVEDDIIDAAISRASVNGYIIDNDISDNMGVKVTCSDTNTDKYLDVEVRITAQIQSSFLHLVFNRPLMNTVTAIARIRPIAPKGGGNGIIALNETQCKQGGQYVGGIYLDGTTIEVVSDGGGMSSNTCIIRNGNSEIVVLNSDPPAYARTSSDWTNDGVFVDGNGDPLTMEQSSTYNLQVTIDPPKCTGLPINPAKIGGIYQPGIYTNGIKQDGTLAPGLYCVDQPSNGKLANLQGNGVTMYFRTGNVEWNGGFSHLTAPAEGSVAPAVPGLLFYFGDGGFTMLGNATAELSGTIYAPYGTIDLGGAETTYTWETVLIGNNVKIHGNPFVAVKVDYKKVLTDPSYLDLLK